jgi:hypothetical protein
MFDLFQPTPQSYEGQPVSLTMTRILCAFEAVFGIAPGRVSPLFRAQLQDCVNKNYPALRCSTARAILEGRIPGIEAPVSLQREQKHLRQALFLLDALETMAAAYVESEIEKNTPQFQVEIDILKKTMGTDKLPGVLGIFQQPVRDASVEVSGKRHSGKIPLKKIA